MLAALALREFESFDSQAGVKKNIRAAIERVASRLGNTPTICRKCYVHPEVLSAYAEGTLLLEIKGRVEAELRDELAFLKPEEAAVLPARGPPQPHAFRRAEGQPRLKAIAADRRTTGSGAAPRAGSRSRPGRSGRRPLRCWRAG
ncbi:hypothetical protein [Caenimonas soli]|uniref:hypothetical protein n=1 Tax=Caenimonas soli TaxID=2735555 RepID=UPI002E2CFEDA|nr:hypothetical protein [Caenimonas soli]